MSNPIEDCNVEDTFQYSTWNISTPIFHRNKLKPTPFQLMTHRMNKGSRTQVAPAQN